MASRSAFAARRLVRPGLHHLGLALLFAGATIAVAQESQPPSLPTFAPPGSTPPPDPAAKDAAAGGGIFGNVNEPEDGKWLVDPEGNQYFVKALPKDKIVYRKMGEDTVRLRGGPWFRLAGEDEENIYIKIYKPRNHEPRDKDPGPTPEEIAEKEKTFATETTASDRLRFVRFDEGLPQQGIWRNGFDVADMNADGHLDIVHGPPRRAGGGPWIFLGDSAGNWSIWQDVVFPKMGYAYGDAAAGDWNGDGNMDLALAMHMKGVVAMIGDGKGGFTPWTRGIEYEGPNHRGLPAFTSRTLEVADWDADGDPDLLVLAEGPRGLEHVGKGGYGKLVYLNQGDGTWKKEIDEAQVFGDHFALGDFNGDARLDFATSTNVGGFRALVNFGQPDHAWEGFEIPEMRRGLIWSVTAADFDGNGRADLVTGYYGRSLGIQRGGIDLLLSHDDGTWSRRPVHATKGSETAHFQALGSGDLDGDGAMDIVGGDRVGRLAVFLGDGAGGFSHEAEAELGEERAGCQARHIRMVDLDRDGRDELLVALAGESCATGGSLSVWRTEAATEPEPAEAP